MGNIEHIDQLETYIKDLGDEIERVKKASEYLKLIEQYQSEIAKTSVTLGQSKDQLKLYQEIMESKLELFQTTSRNIEAKQQSLEQSQFNIIASLTELKQQHEKNEKGIISSFKEMNNVVNQNQGVLIGELNRVQNENEKHLKGMTKASKLYFAVNAVLSMSIVGILVYLVIK